MRSILLGNARAEDAQSPHPLFIQPIMYYQLNEGTKSFLFPSHISLKHLYDHVLFSYKLDGETTYIDDMTFLSQHDLRAVHMTFRQLQFPVSASTLDSNRLHQLLILIRRASS